MRMTNRISKYFGHFLSGDKFNRDVLWNVTALLILGFVGLANNSIIKGIRGNYALGLFSIVYAIYIIISQFATGGIHLSVLKSISYNQQDSKKCREIYTSGLILSIVVSLLVAFVFYKTRFFIAAITKSSDDVSLGLTLITPALVFFSFNKVLFSVLNGVRMMKGVAFFQSLRIIFICVSILLMILLKFDDRYLAFGLTAGEIALSLIMFPFVVFKIGMPSITRDIYFWFPEHFRFSLKSILSGVLFNVNIRIDQLMLSHFFEADIVGIYTFASFFIEGINEIALVIRKNVDPILGNLFSTNNIRAINFTIYKIKKNFTPIMIIIFFLSVLGFPFLSVFVGFDTSFLKSWFVLFILMLGVLYSAPVRPFFWVLTQGGKPEYFTLIMLLTAASNVIINLLLISFIGLYGAAIATSLVFILQTVLVKYFAKRMLDVKI